MSREAIPDRFTSHSHRFIHLLGYLFILNVSLRRTYDLAGSFTFRTVVFLLGLFTVLYTIIILRSRKPGAFQRIYFALQVIIIQLLGVFQEYQDTWALLYIVLGFQVAARCSRKEAVGWFSLFGISLLVTLCFEFGVISGVGRAVAYGIIGLLLISYDMQYSQHEDALDESQVLLAELQEAHLKLQDYAAQAEELAVVQERNRMIQELYDSLGQKIFAIQLATETNRLMLEKDPQHTVKQLDDLQEQTQSALSQMRQLIEQWRPG
jgi:signal transduction histidine kinase